METLAIPLLALGGLYIVSNQSKEPKTIQEGFYRRNPYEQLPNTDIPNRNYPDELPVLNAETDLTSKLSTVNPYDTPVVYTDKYFNPNIPGSLTADKKPTSGPTDYYSLTGDKVNADYFTHNNMVPFFGSHLRTTRTDANATESIMDNYTGSGSQIIRKTEQSPLFLPQENYQWAYGAPNATDFYLSRQVASMKMSNVKPFAEQRVAPGIGLGYGTEGSGGFNSGLNSRDMYLEKTVDELRVENKPKAGGIGILGREGPAVSQIMNRGIHGNVEKNRVDTTFELGYDHMLPAKAYQTSQTARAIPINKEQAREFTERDYTGAAGFNVPSQYVEGEYMPSKHIDLGEVPMLPAYSIGANGPRDGDYGLKSKIAYPNNRTVNKQDDYFGAIGGAIGTVVAPLLDILRPSRKENAIGNLRPYQNPSSTVSESYIFNPADRPAPTIRETTEQSKNHLFINAKQNGGAYAVTSHQAYPNLRQTTNTYYAGGASAGERGREPRSYDAEYNTPVTNGIKSSTLTGYTPAGGMSLLNSDMNMTCKPKDSMLQNTRTVVPTMPYQTPSINNLGSSSVSSTQDLYQNIQLDRTQGQDIISQLKGNPY
ncbi:MAG: hypothetical protein EB127_20605, partial [Alphaproteobacteria bacterium]|nr:hypothetical protein [Alphaproteobacteria bacterium]